jgi:tripartite-type tricarboxylate transporter receptor subunit TctC
VDLARYGVICNRRDIVWSHLRAVAGIVAAACILSTAGQAQGVMRWIIPYPAGGPLDATARVIEQRFRQLNPSETVVIENKPGANGLIAAKAIALTAPDGKSWLFTNGALLTTNPLLYPAEPDFDAARALKIVAGVGLQPAVFVVNPDFPAKTVKEFVALAKSKQLAYASGGFGSTGHLTMSYFGKVAAIDLHHIPYRGGAPAMNDLLGGHVSAAFVDIAGAMPLIKSGQLRALAISSASRSPDLPDVPTVAESGYPGFEMQSGFFVMVPAKTADDVVRSIYGKLEPILNDGEVKSRLRNLGIEAKAMSPAEAEKWLASDRERWTRLIAELGIKIEGR